MEVEARKQSQIRQEKELGSLRQWLLQAGLWKARRARVERVHGWRKRRVRWDEVVQWDTSTHDWLEGRGKSYLIALLDGATSRAEARLVTGDSTEENMRTLRLSGSARAASFINLQGGKVTERGTLSLLANVWVAGNRGV